MGLYTELVGTGRPRFAFLHGLFGRGRNFTGVAHALDLRGIQAGTEVLSAEFAIRGCCRGRAERADEVALAPFDRLVARGKGLVRPAKLRKRAAGIVAEIAEVPTETAETCLSEAGGSGKLAVLLAAGVHGRAAAETALEASEGRLRDALVRMPDT